MKTLAGKFQVIRRGTKLPYGRRAMGIFILYGAFDQYRIGTTKQCDTGYVAIKHGRSSHLSGVEVGELHRSLHTLHGCAFLGSQGDGNRGKEVVLVLVARIEHQAQHSHTYHQYSFHIFTFISSPK